MCGMSTVTRRLQVDDEPSSCCQDHADELTIFERPFSPGFVCVRTWRFLSIRFGLLWMVRVDILLA